MSVEWLQRALGGRLNWRHAWREFKGKLDKVETVRPLLDASGTVLANFRNASETGHTWAYVLAGAAAVGEVSDAISEIVDNLDWQAPGTHFPESIQDMLLELMAHRRVCVRADGKETTYVYDDQMNLVLIQRKASDWDSVRLFLPDSVPGIIREKWPDGHWLELSASGVRNLRGHREGRFQSYFRRQDPTPIEGSYLNPLYEAVSSSARVVAVVGPSGNGKTASLINSLHAKNTLSIRYNSGLSTEDILTIVRLVQPDAIILDDVPFKASFDSDLAQLLEQIRAETRVFLTFMSDIGESAPKPGAFYWPGMRPGRVDAVVFLPPPGIEDRVLILRRKGLDDERARHVAGLTEGLTGAYLAEAARRILSGMETERAVALIRLQAPVLVPDLGPLADEVDG